MQIKKYTGSSAPAKDGETVFFIQSHGNNAGRPLRSPIANCWELRTERPEDWEILSIVFLSRILEPFIGGSVIPFLKLSDYKNIVSPILQHAIHENRIINAHYLQIRKIEQQEQNQERIRKLMKDLKTSLSLETFKKINTAAQ